MNIDKIKNANTKILGKNVIYYDEISSTQDIIRNSSGKTCRKWNYSNCR